MSISPSNPKGTRDFLPLTLSKRNYILNIIKENFKLHGFLEIETPALEKNSTLLGKYGNEGDRLVFKILNSGDKVKRADINSLNQNNLSLFTDSLSEKGLRYDLTVPLARFVSQHQNELVFPFKRFQIQKVWRADRPQHGRFQEFTQCDVDIIGPKSIIQEIELIKLYDSIFFQLGFNDIVFKINHRSLLTSLAHYVGFEDKLNEFTTIIDKVEKIGLDGILNELKKIKNSNSISNLSFFFLKDYDTKTLDDLFKKTPQFRNAIDELNTILEFINGENCLNNKIKFDITLARGLNYYTGIIIEATSNSDKSMGSLGGGGRYDNLTSLFNLKSTSGAGISFGLDRIFLQMEKKNLFPKNLKDHFDIIVINFGLNYIKKLYPLIDLLRNDRKKVIIYPANAKLNKQLSYANKHNIAYAILMGENELDNNEIIIKNMKDGKQSNYLIKDVNSSFFKINK
jgi:histidyl-tRNA synthetase